MPLSDNIVNDSFSEILFIKALIPTVETRLKLISSTSSGTAPKTTEHSCAPRSCILLLSSFTSFSVFEPQIAFIKHSTPTQVILLNERLIAVRGMFLFCARACESKAMSRSSISLLLNPSTERLWLDTSILQSVTRPRDRIAVLSRRSCSIACGFTDAMTIPPCLCNRCCLLASISATAPDKTFIPDGPSLFPERCNFARLQPCNIAPAIAIAPFFLMLFPDRYKFRNVWFPATMCNESSVQPSSPIPLKPKSKTVSLG
mmetsp:Transcript_126953/g.355553  ORF Transcript_126953/g.355553 Transcript_126953/m.355553 type:complete len:259 (-) Transcript_126953:932-1708(-)